MKKLNFGKIIYGTALVTFILVSSNAFCQDAHKIDSLTYHPKPLQSIEEAKETISRILNDKYVSVWIPSISRKKIKYEKIVVSDEGIQFELREGTKTISFSNLLSDQDISLKIHYDLFYNTKTGEKYHDTYFDRIVGTNNIYFNIYHSGFGITMPSPSYYPTWNKQLADALYTIQKKLNTQNYSSRLEAFKPLAEKYRALETKPVASEEQRKYLVQGTFFANQKKYDTAIKLYHKALEIDKTSSPMVYYNLANVYGSEHSYDTAIFYMEMYLMLVPEASNARDAQDQIYKWDAIVNPPK